MQGASFEVERKDENEILIERPASDQTDEISGDDYMRRYNAITMENYITETTDQNQFGIYEDSVIYEGEHSRVLLGIRLGADCEQSRLAIKKIKLEGDAGQMGLTEARLLFFLSHAAIISLYRATVHNDSLYIAMEYLEGGTLEPFSRYDVNHCRDDYPILHEKAVAGGFRMVLQALAYLHSMHMAHLDLKPENIMLSSEGVKIIDLGSCTEPGIQFRKPHNDYGTPLFAAPERLRERPEFDEMADIWSIGLIVGSLWYCPFPSLGFKTSQELYQAIEQHMVPCCARPEDHISPCAIAFVNACVQFDPRDRQTAEQLLQDQFILGGYSDKQVSSYIVNEVIGKMLK